MDSKHQAADTDQRSEEESCRDHQRLGPSVMSDCERKREPGREAERGCRWSRDRRETTARVAWVA